MILVDVNLLLLVSFCLHRLWFGSDRIPEPLEVLPKAPPCVTEPHAAVKLAFTRTVTRSPAVMLHATHCVILQELCCATKATLSLR